MRESPFIMITFLLDDREPDLLDLGMIHYGRGMTHEQVIELLESAADWMKRNPEREEKSELKFTR